MRHRSYSSISIDFAMIVCLERALCSSLQRIIVTYILKYIIFSHHSTIQNSKIKISQISINILPESWAFGNIRCCLPKLYNIRKAHSGKNLKYLDGISCFLVRLRCLLKLCICNIAYFFGLTACIHDHFGPCSNARMAFGFFAVYCYRKAPWFPVVLQGTYQRQTRRREWFFPDNKYSNSYHLITFLPSILMTYSWLFTIFLSFVYG
jgi:hypothetical protein